MDPPGVPVIEIAGLVKDYRGLRPLRLASLVVERGDRVSIAGLDATSAEVLVNLINGAILPDTGRVRIFGQDTADIGSEAEWLASLERFGMVTPRAVLLEGATLLQNLALPITLEIDPVSDDVRRRVSALAARVGLAPPVLDARAGDVAPEIRMRVHLARALVLRPAVLLFEHPTLGMAAEVVPLFARDVRRVLDEEQPTVLALTNDEVFNGAVARRHYHLRPATGELTSGRGWRRWLGI